MFVFLTTETWKRDGTFQYGNLVDELANLEDTAIRNRDTDDNRGEEDEEDEEIEEDDEENEGSGENLTVSGRLGKKRPKGKRPKGKRPKGKRPKGKRPKGKRPKGKSPKGKRPKGKRPRQRRPNKRQFIRRDGSKDDPYGLNNNVIYDRIIHNDRRLEDRFIEDESM